MKLLNYSISLFAIGLFFTACGKSSNGGTDTTSTAIAFYQADGVCFKANNDVVSDSKCDDLKYFIEEGECFQKSNDKKVSISKCTSNKFFISDNDCMDRSGRIVSDSSCGSDISTGSKACKGEHVEYDDFGAPNIINCDGKTKTGNCSGAILLNRSTQLFVNCP